jgi:hypothetical protein
MISGLVIAGTYVQYCDWLIKNQLSNMDYKYISIQEDWAGYHNIPIFLVGDYYQNQAFIDLIAWKQIAYLQDIHDCKLFKKERDV